MKRIEKLSKLPKDDKTTFEFLETNKENSKKWKPKYGEYYSYIDDEGDAYEKHFGVSDEFPNHNVMTLRVCPFCGSADIEKFNAHIKCEEDEKDYDYAEESEN